jgi:hypothetical protein
MEGQHGPVAEVAPHTGLAQDSIIEADPCLPTEENVKKRKEIEEAKKKMKKNESSSSSSQGAAAITVPPPPPSSSSPTTRIFHAGRVRFTTVVRVKVRMTIVCTCYNSPSSRIDLDEGAIGRKKENEEEKRVRVT